MLGVNTYLASILITGGQGQLAKALCHHPLAKQFRLIPCSHQQLDITNSRSIQTAFREYQPDIVVNAAAYTAVDRAEEEREQAACINHHGARQLALACNDKHIPLIHLSTNYIFDGRKTAAYTEEDAANPINYYGETKWLGEEAVRAECEQHIILRVASLFGEFGNNYLKTMLQLSRDRTELRIVADQISNPTYTGDIASAILNMATQTLHTWGTYHFANVPPCSWYDFTLAIIEEMHRHTHVKVEKVAAITTEDYPRPANRPLNAVLDSNKISADYQIELTDWQLALQSIIKPML